MMNYTRIKASADWAEKGASSRKVPYTAARGIGRCQTLQKLFRTTSILYVNRGLIKLSFKTENKQLV